MDTGRQKRNGETGKGRNGEKTSPIRRFPNSPINLIYCGLLAACWLMLTAGCQRESTPPQPPASEAKKAISKPAPPVAEVKEEEKKIEEVVIDTKQRNPFRPFIIKTTEKAAIVIPKTPLQKYELEELKLIAIIWGIENPIAMVETPDGKGYSVRRGDLIGNRDGKVRRIEKNKVIVEERLTEASGEVSTSEFVIQLPLAKGEEEIR